MRVLVAAKKYTKYYPDPIAVKRGDRVKWLPKDSEWPGWLWCIHPVTSKAGWVPVKYLKVQGDAAEVLQDYSAAELDAEVGEKFTALREEAGWIWCKSGSGEEGWLPLELFPDD